MNAQADVLIEAIRRRGCKPHDLRDAVHEAHHALEAKVPDGEWTRDAIHRRVMKLGPGRSGPVVSEIMARAVEQIVCRELGEEPGPIEKWALVACTEAAKHGLPFMTYEQTVRAITQVVLSKEARAAADRVLALGRST